MFDSVLLLLNRNEYWYAILEGKLVKNKHLGKFIKFVTFIIGFRENSSSRKSIKSTVNRRKSKVKTYIFGRMI